MTWENIDFDAKTIYISQDSSKSGKQLIIPMNNKTYETLKAWKEQNKASAGLVFKNPHTGKKFDNCNKAWASLLEAADITNFRWHDMRHDFASRLVMAGIDLNTVRELLGHSDIRMTLRYAHLAPTKTKSAVDILDKQSTENDSQ